MIAIPSTGPCALQVLPVPGPEPSTTQQKGDRPAPTDWDHLPEWIAEAVRRLVGDAIPSADAISVLNQSLQQLIDRLDANNREVRINTSVT